MRLVFDTCTPRPEVLEGELTGDIFAARLKDVIDGVAVPVYQDAETFFHNTYPTAGLRLLLGEALGRLTGARAGNSPILRLETAFGGGKTHNLIALRKRGLLLGRDIAFDPVTDWALMAWDAFRADEAPTLAL